MADKTSDAPGTYSDSGPGTFSNDGPGTYGSEPSAPLVLSATGGFPVYFFVGIAAKRMGRY